MNLDLPPDALAAQARKTIEQFGYTGPIADRAWGYDYNNAYLNYLRVHKSKVDWQTVANSQPSPVAFSYRESAAPLEPHSFVDLGRVTQGDPPPIHSGMAFIALDLSGRMMKFTAVPAQLDTSAPASTPPDPAPLFAAAGLDLKTFQPATPQWTPLSAVDSRAAWTGTFPGRPENPIRIEAAWWRNKPVYFQEIGPWTNPDRAPASTNRSRTDYVWNALIIGGLILAAFLTWRNLRLGRGDRRGAMRLAVFAFVLDLLSFLLRLHAGSFGWGYELFMESLAEALWAGAQFWLCYLALEPVVRRYWPHTLISWTRVLSGAWRDSVVGRDVLIGTLVGLGYDLIFAGSNELMMREGAPPSTGTYLESLLGFHRSFNVAVNRLSVGIIASLLFFLMFFLLRVILRKEWLAAVAFTAFMAIRGLSGGFPAISIPTAILVYGLIVFVLLRFGLLAMVVAIFITDMVPELAFTTNLTAWYASGTLLVIVIVAALSVVAFRYSLGSNRPLAAFLDQ